MPTTSSPSSSCSQPGSRVTAMTTKCMGGPANGLAIAKGGGMRVGLPLGGSTPRPASHATRENRHRAPQRSAPPINSAQDSQSATGNECASPFGRKRSQVQILSPRQELPGQRLDHRQDQRSLDHLTVVRPSTCMRRHVTGHHNTAGRGLDQFDEPSPFEHDRCVQVDFQGGNRYPPATRRLAVPSRAHAG
jgi:hypothetical protein